LARFDAGVSGSHWDNRLKLPLIPGGLLFLAATTGETSQPTTFIRPAIWKQPLGVACATKEGARYLALKRWPAAAHFFPLKRHHNLTEARGSVPTSSSAS
jgi:hypothetical protein